MKARCKLMRQGRRATMNREISNDGQTDVLSDDANPTTWVSHPIDIRISIPFFHVRYYFTIVGGRERRPGHRRKAERVHFPIITFGNAFFVLGVATLFSLMAVGLLIARSAIIEY